MSSRLVVRTECPTEGVLPDLRPPTLVSLSLLAQQSPGDLAEMRIFVQHIWVGLLWG